MGVKALHWKELQRNGELGTVNHTKVGLRGETVIWFEADNRRT